MTHPGKEGPPTLLDKLEKYIGHDGLACEDDSCVCGLREILDALERDEKRTAALKKLEIAAKKARPIILLNKNGSVGLDVTGLGYGELMRDLAEATDALTPALEEKE